MIQKREGNYSGNLWRRGTGTQDADGGLVFNGSEYTSSVTNGKEDRVCTNSLDGKILET